jgi:methionine synthase II (cobalamin-independent)
MEKTGLFTTCVGSLPLENTPENMKKGFNDQINVGIDYPCYPQLVGMNSMFLSPLSKVVEPLQDDNDKFSLSDDFKIPDKIVALEYGEFMVNFLKEFPHLKERIKGTKACLTGPFTLTGEIILRENMAKGIEPTIFKEPRAIMDESLVEKFAEIMKRIGKAYNDMGINIISMDEPTLGLIVGRKPHIHNEEFIVEMLNKSMSEIKGMSSIHICGRISPALRDIILQTDVKIMDHEFRGSEGNFKTFDKSHFENTDKYLAMGTVETKVVPIKDGKVKDYVEDIDFLRGWIKRGIDHFGKENLVIKSDCGLGPLLGTFGEELGYEIATRKLNNMVLALQEFK